MPRLTADTSGDHIVSEFRGPFSITLGDTFGGGTVQINFKDADGTWEPFNDSAFTAPAQKLYNNVGPVKVQLVFSGSSGANLLYRIDWANANPVTA